MYQDATSVNHRRSRGVTRSAFNILGLLAIVATTSIAMAPAASARGAADCFDASGNLSFDGKTYTVDIRNRCFPNQEYGQSVTFRFSLLSGLSCGSQSGTLFVSSLGQTLRVSTTCLTPGTYRPDLTLTGFAPTSYKTIYFPSFQVRAPEPSPTPSIPTPTPTPTIPRPSPTQAPVTPVAPVPSPTVNNPSPLTLSVRRTWRGTQVLSSSVTQNDYMRARVKTKLKPGSKVTVSVRYSNGEEKNQEVVKRNGIVTFTTYVEQYNVVNLLDNEGRNLVRWTTR